MKTNVPAIARAQLFRVCKNRERIAITVEIGQPIQADDGFWHTPVALLGLDGRLSDICGEDSLQSLCLAVEMVHRRLMEIIKSGDRLIDDEGDEFSIGTYFPKS